MLDISGIQLQLKQSEGKTLVYDPVRKKWLVLTPEEHVRQYFLHHIIHNLKYPAGMIAVEKKIIYGSLSKRFDVVVYNREHQPWMLAECKEPATFITETTLHQLLQYQRTMQCHYWVLTNGHQLFCADACDTGNILWSGQLPAYHL